MKIQCHCGGGIKTMRAKFAKEWLGAHNCPGPEAEGDGADPAEPPYVHHAGSAQAERSFQEPQHGGTSYVPDVNAIVFGFQMNPVG